MKFLKKYSKKYWKLFAIAVFFLSLETACDLFLPTLMAHMIDGSVASHDFPALLRSGSLMLLITAFGACCAVGRNILSSQVSQSFGAELRLDLFSKIHSLSFENLDKFDKASLVTRLTSDITQVQNFVNGLMRIFVKAPLLFIGAIAMAIRLNAHLSLVLVGILPLVILTIVYNLRKGFPLFRRVQEALDRINSVIREYLSSVRVVKAFNNFKFEMQRFENANQKQTDATVKAMQMMARFLPSVILLINLGIVVVLWIGGVNIASRKIQVGQIMAFINYLTQILFSLMMIAMVFVTFVRAKASAERIDAVFSEQNTQTPHLQKGLEQFHDDPKNKGRIDFENVFFSYKDSSGEPVLKNISFTCFPGETVGIIGSTGAGKSTLVTLIPRFYDIDSGSIKVHSQDIRHFEPKYLRENIAIVPQKTTLFSGTILENIKWGRETASLDEIISVAKVAQAHDFISTFPEGYNTLLGQGGVNLSGGQKQRISIARALLRMPEILILDDCTSSVDVSTEKKIRLGIKDFSSDLTSLIIAQRIISISDADKILVLDDGEIVGLGTHDELLESSQVYKDIYLSQIGREEKTHG